MKQLELNLGAPLFEKNRRPALLTPLGVEVSEKAGEIVASLDDLQSLASTDDVRGSVKLGFVSTTLQTLLPVVLRQLQRQFPNLKVSVHSGLSGQLAQLVESNQLDFAYLSAPVQDYSGVVMHEIGSEPLFLVTAKSDKTTKSVNDVLRHNPFISFDRRTWLGEQIARHLTERGVFLEPAIELDSIDAIEHLVTEGFGVSILPQRILAPPLQNNLRCIALGTPAPQRRVVLATPRRPRRQTVLQCLASIANPK